jgi:hypothetical protein
MKPPTMALKGAEIVLNISALSIFSNHNPSTNAITMTATLKHSVAATIKLIM